MAGFHVSADRKSRPCEAEPGQCPLGFDTPHFDTKEETDAWIDEDNLRKYGSTLHDTLTKKPTEDNVPTQVLNDGGYDNPVTVSYLSPDRKKVIIQKLRSTVYNNTVDEEKMREALYRDIQGGGSKHHFALAAADAYVNGERFANLAEARGYGREYHKTLQSQGISDNEITENERGYLHAVTSAKRQAEKSLHDAEITGEIIARDYKEREHLGRNRLSAFMNRRRIEELNDSINQKMKEYMKNIENHNSQLQEAADLRNMFVKAFEKRTGSRFGRNH